MRRSATTSLRAGPTGQASSSSRVRLRSGGRPPSGSDFPEEKRRDDRDQQEQQSDNGSARRHDDEGKRHAGDDENPGNQGPAVFEISEKSRGYLEADPP